jgi:hypothetical protein
MTHKPDTESDPNVAAARIVRESTKGEPDANADLEAAWLAWSGHIQNVDERVGTLLKAAIDSKPSRKSKLILLAKFLCYALDSPSAG